MLVGILTTNDREVAVFEYDQDWLINGFSISPFELPLERAFKCLSSLPIIRLHRYYEGGILGDRIYG